MKIEQTKISDLKPYGMNARTHSDGQVAQVAASIREFGFTNPVLVDGIGGIIAGHCRVMAALQLGMKEVPTIALYHLSEMQKRAYIIADNKLALNAGWNEELLSLELEALKLDGFDLDLIGFTDDELNVLLPDGEEDGDGDGDREEDEIPEPPENPVSRAGDVWLLGDVHFDCPDCGKSYSPTEAAAMKMECRLGKLVARSAHRLMCGDSTDAGAVAVLMKGDVADLCFTSPPYGQQRNYKQKIGDWDALMRGVFSVLPVGEKSQILVNLGVIHSDGEWQPYWQEWVEWMRAGGWRRFGWYVWDQGSGLPGDWNGRLAPSFEFVFHFNKDARKPNKTVPKLDDSIEYRPRSSLRNQDGSKGQMCSPEASLQTHKIPDSVIRINRHNRDEGHPAVFPVALPEFVISAYSNHGDVVYEPFSGSGSSIIAAENAGRRCRAIEISPAYVDVSVQRWQKATGKTAYLESTGQPFNG